MENLNTENVVTVNEDFDMHSLLDDSLPSSCSTGSSISHEEDNNPRGLRFKLLEICRTPEDIRDEFVKFHIAHNTKKEIASQSWEYVIQALYLGGLIRLKDNSNMLKICQK